MRGIPFPRCPMPAHILALLLISASCAWAQVSPAAHVVALTGQVSILKDNIPWALHSGDSVQPGQMIVTGVDGYAIFELADTSQFEVFPSSKLIFRDNPGNWKDLLEIWIGRIKVHVQRLGGRPNFNRVRTPTAVISVRGTVFYVSVEDDDATTLVVVDEGQVAVEHTLLPSGSARVLNAGEWIRVYKRQPLASKAVDRGSLLQAAFRAVTDVLYGAIYRDSQIPRGSTSPAPGGGSVPGPGPAPLPGDTGSDQPPPPPPPSN